MFRSPIPALLSFFVLVLLLSPAAFAAAPSTFFIELAVPLNGGPPSIALDATGRPWIGYSDAGTMHFGVRDEGGWSFETVPFPVDPKTGIVIDAQGSPAVAHWGEFGTLNYVFKDEGQWVSETTNTGFFPEGSALTVGPAGQPYTMCIWSYHNLGYVTLMHKLGSAWNLIIQYQSPYWFNPGTAAVDLDVDGSGEAHAVVNPTGDSLYYHGPGSAPTFPNMKYFAIAVDSQNEPLVAYITGDEVQVMTRESGLWETFTVDTLDDCGRLDVVFDGDDVPHIVYCDRSSGPGNIVYAVRGSYGGPWQVQEIDAGSAVSISVDADRHLHVAYMAEVGPSEFGVKYATTDVPTPTETTTWGSLKSYFRQ